MIVTDFLKSSSVLPFLEFFLGYSKVPLTADEQHLNLCVCPLRHKQGTNTQCSVLDWYTPTRYPLRHRDSHRNLMNGMLSRENSLSYKHGTYVMIKTETGIVLCHASMTCQYSELPLEITATVQSQMIIAYV